jgi:hypothetical protein
MYKRLKLDLYLTHTQSKFKIDQTHKYKSSYKKTLRKKTYANSVFMTFDLGYSFLDQIPMTIFFFLDSSGV